MDVGVPGTPLAERANEGALAEVEIADMSGPGALGNTGLGGPISLTARAAAIGSADDVAQSDGKDD